MLHVPEDELAKLDPTYARMLAPSRATRVAAALVCAVLIAWCTYVVLATLALWGLGT
jgi:hypothetical protein